MSILSAFGLGAGLALVVSLMTVALLRPHLARLLEELCGSRARAGFWNVVSLLSVAQLGILAGTTHSGYPEEAPGVLSVPESLFGIVTQVRAALMGLLVSLLAVAWLLWGFIRRFEQGIHPSPVARTATEPVAGARAARERWLD